MTGRRSDEDEMDDETAARIWGPGSNWERKTCWAPGIPDDLSQLPILIYQVLAGRVFTTLRWPDGSVARGEVSPQALRSLNGREEILDGFYDALGDYLGETWVDEEAWSQEEPRLKEQD